MRGLWTAMLLLAVVTAQIFHGQGPAAAAEAIARSLALNGTTAYAEAPNIAELDIQGDWTVELWFKDGDPNGFDHDYRYLLNKGDGLAFDSPYYVLVGNGSLLAGVRSDGVNHPLTYNLHSA